MRIQIGAAKETSAAGRAVHLGVLRKSKELFVGLTAYYLCQLRLVTQQYNMEILHGTTINSSITFKRIVHGNQQYNI